MRHPATILAVSLLLLPGALSLHGCRSCSPERSARSSGASTASTEDTSVAEPASAAPEHVAAANPQPSPAAPDGAAPPAPPGGLNPQLLEAAHRLQAGQSVDAALAGLAIDDQRNLLVSYVRCLAGTRPEACAQLGAQADSCRLDAEHIAARSRGPRGWIATPAFTAMTVQAGTLPADLLRYAEAVETANPTLCPDVRLTPNGNECPASASGNLSWCDTLGPRPARDCRRRAAFLVALRRGVSEVPAADIARSDIAISPGHVEGCMQVIARPREGPTAQGPAAPTP